MDMQIHFNGIASAYRDLRYTDYAPITYIEEKIGRLERLVGLELGAGTGRYSMLLAKHFPQLHSTCVDSSSGMLTALQHNFGKAGLTNYETLHSRVETATLPASHFNTIFTFNALHHFNLKLFLQKCARWLSPAGHLFIYTRLRQQNARNIWGKHFPDFVDKENRLPTLESIEAALKNIQVLKLVDYHEFCYERQSNLQELLKKIEQAHYSTFRLYSPAELHHARQQFVRQIKQKYSNAELIKWQDFNIMLYLQHQSAN